MVEWVEKTAESEYTKGSHEEKVKRFLADEQMRKRLRSDKVNKSIHWGRQDKHVPGTNNYKEGRSYLTIPKEEVQPLIEQNAGTGTIKRKPDNSFNRRKCAAQIALLAFISIRKPEKEWKRIAFLFDIQTTVYTSFRQERKRNE